MALMAFAPKVRISCVEAVLAPGMKIEAFERRGVHESTLSATRFLRKAFWMKVDGRCLCGYLSYEAEVDENLVEICNCTDCQALSGSAFRVNVPVIDGMFRFLSGDPKTYCPACGTSVYSRPEDGKDGFFGLRVGSLRQRADLIPRAQCWRSSAQAWIDHIADLPAFEGDVP